MGDRKFRYAVREGTSKVFADGVRRTAIGFGVKVGYWPCLRAPYIEIAFGTKRYGWWYGLPTYKQPERLVAMHSSTMLIIDECSKIVDIGKLLGIRE